MKNNFVRLQLLIQIFGSDSFYNCEVTRSAATCMGRFNPEVLLKALKYKFKMTASPNGYIWLTRGSYSITLTD
jgi:hypothetical protein